MIFLGTHSQNCFDRFVNRIGTFEKGCDIFSAYCYTFYIILMTCHAMGCQSVQFHAENEIRRWFLTTNKQYRSARGNVAPTHRWRTIIISCLKINKLNLKTTKRSPNDEESRRVARSRIGRC